MKRVGIIGFGNRMKDIVSNLLKTNQAEIAAVADVNLEQARKNAEACGVENCKFYSSAEEMLEQEKLDGVCIGTRCSLHTHYALMVARKRIPMFLEKPVCTTYEDLNRLKEILYWSDNTVVSFPLRLTEIVEHVKTIIDSGKIGEVAHVQAYNNVPYARGYYQKWYRDEKETGGLFLQKATHDLDYINYVLGNTKPTVICAMKSKQVFKGNKPAGFKCSDCDERKTCPDSPENVKKYFPDAVLGEYCCFAEDTGNEDSGSLIVRYDNDMHVVYSQDFIVRAAAGKRGARFIGHLGTVEFDFNTGIVTVYHHMKRITETHTFDTSNASHFGGDGALMRNFVGVMLGEEKSNSTLEAGILSAEMCLAAKLSSETDRFVSIGS